jgi:hypothetical protein
MKKILTIGGAMHDIFIEYDDQSVLHTHTPQEQSFILLEEGRKIEVNTIYDFVGGGAANTAVTFKRLGFDVAAFFKIGTDAQGELIINSLTEQNIDLEYVVKTAEEKTGTSFIIPCGSGDRVALVYRGANLNIGYEDINPKAFENRDAVYITSLSKSAAHSLIPITKTAKKNGALVAVNPGGSQLNAGFQSLVDSLGNIDIFVLNAQEAQQFMECIIKSGNERKHNLEKPFLDRKTRFPSLLEKSMRCDQYTFTYIDYLKEILSRGPKIAVITNGAEGVYIATESTIYFYPAPDIHVVGTLGAGDAFSSCFTGMLLLGSSIERALLAGIYNSCSVISHLGTQTGILNRADLEEQINSADMGLLKTFNF